MRISDWSSDVCSSDLPVVVPPGMKTGAHIAKGAADQPSHRAGVSVKKSEQSPPASPIVAAVLREQVGGVAEDDDMKAQRCLRHREAAHRPALPARQGARRMDSGVIGDRSEESCVGKECVCTCRTRWLPEYK